MAYPNQFTNNIDSEKFYHFLFDRIPQMMAIHNAKRFLYINPAGTMLLGEGISEEIYEKAYFNFIHPAYRDIEEKQLQQLLKEKNPIDYIEKKFVCLNGNVIDVEVASIPIYYQAQLVVQIMVRDISDSKQELENFRSSELRFRKLFELAPDPYYLYDLKGNIIDCNKALEEISLYKKNELIGKNFFQSNLLPIKQILRARKILLYDASKQPVSPEEFILIRKDKSEVPIEIRSIPIKMRSQLLILGIARDITERKVLEEARRKFKFIADSSKDFMTLINTDYVYEAANKAYCKILNRDRDEIVGKTVAEIWGQDLFENQIKKNLDSCFQGNEVNYEYWFQFHQSEKGFYTVSYSPYFNDRGEVSHAVVVSHDITKRKQAEEALKQQRQWLKVTLSSIGDAVIATDINQNITFINPIAEEITGWNEQEILGLNINTVFNLIHEKSKEALENPVKQILNEGIIVRLSEHIILTTKYNQEISVNICGSPIRNPNDMMKIHGVVLVFQDITELKQAEDESKRMQMKIIAASKLATLGEVATGVAHEINQPLTYISTLIQRFIMSYEYQQPIKTEKLLKDLKYSFEQVNRITSIIDHLRTFGRKHDIQMEKISLLTVLNNTLLLMSERIRLKNIIIDRQIQDNLPEIQGNANQLEQVFINLFQNALDAFGDKPHKTAKIFLAMEKENRQLRIQFSDNGPGMKQAIINKVFEPFFTTKEAGKGTGLGLAIVYGIVRDHNGSITCESDLNKGTNFNIFIPVYEKEMNHDK